MSLKEDIMQIMSLYSSAKNSSILRNQVEGVFQSLKEKLVNLPVLKRRTHVWIDVYTGDGNLANVPWIAFVDERETENVLGDVYCVLLFKADMSGVYLTVNQGSVMAQNGIPTIKHLEDIERTTFKFKSSFQLLNHHNFCLDGHIDLGDFSQIGRLYEKGTIAYKFYAKGNLPQDWEIENDIENILNTYEKFIEEHPDGIARIENPQQTNQFLTSPKTKVVEDETKIIDEVSKILKQVNYQKVEKKFHVLDPPKMQRVRDIISAVESKWKLPNFQRYFDWEPEDVREFIDSVFNDFYVGSFLLWEKAANTEPDLELINIDGVRESIKDPTAIILDGQQRITSLYWAIKGPRIDSKPSKSAREILLH